MPGGRRRPVEAAPAKRLLLLNEAWCARGRVWGVPLPLPHFFATPARGGETEMEAVIWRCAPTMQPAQRSCA